MDAVLGLSVTPSAVGLVLVEGHDADGATMDRDAFPVRSRGRSRALHTSEQAAAAVMRTEAIAAKRGHRLHAIGVTWSEDADMEASLLLKSLTDSGFDNVVGVRLPEATEALARGIAAVTGYQTTAVCVIEPEAVIVLIVHADDGAVQTAINHMIDSEEELVSWLSGSFTRSDWQPEALVVVGSGGDLDAIMLTLEDALSLPVFAPAEAQLALARGAALASAQNTEVTFDDPDVHDRHRGRHADARQRRPLTQAAPLAMLVSGVLTFVVSLSAALTLQFTPKKDVGVAESRQTAKTSAEAPAAVSHMPPALPPPVAIPVPVAEAPPPPEAPPQQEAPAEVLPPPVVPAEAPVGGTDVPEMVPDVPPPPAADLPGAPVPQEPVMPLPPAPPPPLPAQVAPAPVPVERPGILHRIKERLSGGGDDVQQAPVLAPPPPEAPPPPPPDAPPLLPPP